ncbi:MAG: hypothetical protein ACRBDI_09640 [Alphaproteobacteria bacterium]
MHALPPPPAVISIPVIQYNISLEIDVLTISVDHARYDAIAQKAILDLNQAYEKSGKIMSHKGKTIALTYQGKIKTGDIKDCPEVRVPYTDIKRDINFIKNTVTLTISNINQDLADRISTSHCLSVDSYTVKKVVNPDFDKKPGSKLNR